MDRKRKLIITFMRNRLTIFTVAILILSIIVTALVSFASISVTVSKELGSTSDVVFRKLWSKDCIFVVLGSIPVLAIAIHNLRKGSKVMARNVQMNSFGVLAGVYEGMYVINPMEDTVREVKSLFNHNVHLFDNERAFSEQISDAVNNWILEEHRERMMRFNNIGSVMERLNGKNSVSREFEAERVGWCRASYIANRDVPNGPIKELILAIEVIDEEKRQQEAIRQESENAKAANSAKDRFLANISHEIRTPINAVLGMDTMILRETKEPQTKEYAMSIQRAGETLLSLINDILDISKIESGKMEIVPAEYDLAGFLHDVMNMVRVKADSKGLKVNLEVDENLPKDLYGDDIRIRQILINIMNNAVKYTEEGSVTLKLTGERQGDNLHMHYSIKDTGIGIKEEDMPKLFEAFQRIEESRNRNVEGTGLGMSITIQLLALMDSKLQVESEYGVGSTFSFDLVQPVRSEEVVGDLNKRFTETAENFEYESKFIAPDAKILVVDDNKTNRMVFTFLLKETQMKIEEASGGAQALDMIWANRYDIIFLDHMMPEIDGLEVIARMKASNEHPNVETPVIALTANALSSAKEEYMSYGFDDYVSKPVHAETLEQKISNFLPEELKVHQS